MKIIQKVKSAQSGDLDSIVDLISDQKLLYYKIAMSYLKNSEDALDAIEEMTVKIFYDINKLKKEEAFYGWSKKILVNICLNMIRSNKKIIYTDDLEIYEKEDDVILKKDLEMDIVKYLDRVSQKQREALELKYYHDLDYKTISKKTNTPVGTVKSRIFNGLKILKECMEGED